MKIAVVGAGIAGNTVAHSLHRGHDVTVFEANGYAGGHSHTLDVELGGEAYAVDTGFIVFNDRTYPGFIALLAELGVASQPTEMSFSVQCAASGLEYNGRSLNTLFAQRRNLLRPSFQRMIFDIVRFNREAIALLEGDDERLTLGDYLARGRYSRAFVEHYVVPMGAAIWSTDPTLMLDFPARYFVRFFHQHGLLGLQDRPQWRTVQGGSRRYVDKLIAGFRRQLRLNAPVQCVRRFPDHVEVKARGAPVERFDCVFLACHSDQALALLADTTPLEREVLGAIRYQENEVVLHTDSSLLPRRRLAWAAWNYHVLDHTGQRVALTYNMNILQGLRAPAALCVTVNHAAAIDPAKILYRTVYHHPLYTPAAVAAQRRRRELHGHGRTYFCGAYWRYGFHEDGVASALAALADFHAHYRDAKLPLLRAG